MRFPGARFSWWKRLSLVGGLLGSITSRQEITEDDIEELKKKDMLESVFTEFAAQDTDIYKPLIDERDRYMAARLQEEIQADGHKHVLAVIGAGHLKGIAAYLQAGDKNPGQTVAELDSEPPPRRWPRILPWLVVALVIAGFVTGFIRNPSLGWQ